MSKVAANVNIRYSSAGLDQLLELLRSTEFVGFAWNDKAQLELTCLASAFRSAGAGRPHGLGRVVVIVIVVVMMIMVMVMVMIVMIVPVIMLMVVVLVMIMLMIVFATRAMNMCFVFRIRT